VIAVDSNLLVYAHRRDSEFHGAAEDALQQLSEGTQQWAIPWPCLAEFYSMATHPRLYDPPSLMEQAVGQIDAWLESPSLILLGEVAAWSSLRDLLVRSKVTGPRVHDARIAALCIGHGVRELWTADRDYGRFPGLRTHNPLAIR
jgi:uncharacterized protein